MTEQPEWTVREWYIALVGRPKDLIMLRDWILVQDGKDTVQILNPDTSDMYRARIDEDGVCRVSIPGSAPPLAGEVVDKLVELLNLNPEP